MDMDSEKVLALWGLTRMPPAPLHSETNLVH